MSEIELAGIRKIIGRAEILAGIDLAVGDGEFVVLVGPSGCGKSTLLRIIAGLDTPTDGDVRIDGASVLDVQPSARNVAMVFQGYALYPHMSVADNLGFSLKLAGRSRQEIGERVRKVALNLQLEDLLSRKPAQLSGGQRQRVAIGRAIVREPKAFLFDEPLSNLDAKLRVDMRAEIKTLQRRLGITAVYVTHDQVEAMTLADRVVVMNGGRIEQAGAPLEIYRQPANLFVAGFIGSPGMNFLPARIETAGDRLVLAFAQEANLSLDATLARHGPGRSVIVGLRPEHIRRTHEGGDLTGPIDLVEPTGAVNYARFRFAGQSCMAMVEGDQSVRIGDRFNGRVDPHHLHLFDPASGARLV